MQVIDGIHIQKKIGRGSFGEVFMWDIPDIQSLSPTIKSKLRKGRKLVWKIISMEKVSNKLEKITQREIDICLKMNDDNITRCVHAKRFPEHICLFFEYWNGGDLKNFIKVYKRYEQSEHPSIKSEIVKLLTQKIAQGLNYLYKEHIIHRDIKLDNILLHFPDYKNEGTVTNDYLYDFDPEYDRVEVVISDLGLARELAQDQATYSVLGTPITMAPEIHNRASYNHSVDIWSLGAIVFEMFTWCHPFEGFNTRNLVQNINQGIIEIPKGCMIPKLGIEFLKGCLKHDPTKRLTHAELLSHPFLSEEVALDESKEVDEEAYSTFNEESKEELRIYIKEPKDYKKVDAHSRICGSAPKPCIEKIFTNSENEVKVNLKSNGLEVIEEKEFSKCSPMYIFLYWWWLWDVNVPWTKLQSRWLFQY